MPWFLTWAVYSDPLPKSIVWRDGAEEQVYSTALRWLLPQPLDPGQPRPSWTELMVCARSGSDKRGIAPL